MSGRDVRVGVDVGGTFTDVICHDLSAGTILVGKTPTERDDPAGGVLRAIEQTLEGAPLAEVTHVSHGTTVGLNAILERRGAVTGLLCTSGFRDVLEIRRGSRDDAFNLLWMPPPPLVPRRLRCAVRERIRADGSVLQLLVTQDVLEAGAAFDEAGVESVAVAFINAWANPEHEQQAGALLREHGFRGEITLSHELSREYREFERTSTAVVNAYIRPKVARYLTNLATSMALRGFIGRFDVMRSGGGTMSVADAQHRPFEAIFSGPVAGAEAAARVAREIGAGIAVAADVGGTSFDTALIVDGRPHVMTEGAVAGMPVQSSWVDVRSIGAGGGSIASIDEGGLLRVGPASAGSEPGPASYRRGGTDPTVTDAAAALGMLGEGRLGGAITLDLVLAEQALAPLAERLEMSVASVARGVITVSSAAMADAIREITVERGLDPREASLVVFGGAGPLFGTLLARELSIGQVVVPPHAGNFSAWGLLGADSTRETAMTFLRPLTEETIAEADIRVAELLASMPPARREAQPSAQEISADVRYRGQEHSLTVPFPRASETRGKGRVAALAEVFGRRYRDTYLHELDHELELVALRASTRTPSGLREWPPLPSATHSPERRTVTSFSFSLESVVEFALVERASLGRGEVLAGPAIISEQTTTTYLDAGFVAQVHDSGCLLLRNEESSLS